MMRRMRVNRLRLGGLIVLSLTLCAEGAEGAGNVRVESIEDTIPTSDNGCMGTFRLDTSNGADDETGIPLRLRVFPYDEDRCRLHFKRLWFHIEDDKLLATFYGNERAIPAAVWNLCIELHDAQDKLLLRSEQAIANSGVYRVNVTPHDSNWFTLTFELGGADVAEAAHRFAFSIEQLAPDDKDADRFDAIRLPGTLIRVTGRVTDPDGHPLENVHIEATDRTADTFLDTYTDSDGRYVLDMRGRVNDQGWHHEALAFAIIPTLEGWFESNKWVHASLYAGARPLPANNEYGADPERVLFPRPKPYQVDFVMEPAVIVRGQCLFGGKPFASHFTVTWEKEPKRWDARIRVQADDDGRFRVTVPLGQVWFGPESEPVTFNKPGELGEEVFLEHHWGLYPVFDAHGKRVLYQYSKGVFTTASEKQRAIEQAKEARRARNEGPFRLSNATDSEDRIPLEYDVAGGGCPDTLHVKDIRFYVKERALRAEVRLDMEAQPRAQWDVSVGLHAERQERRDGRFYYPNAITEGKCGDHVDNWELAAEDGSVERILDFEAGNADIATKARYFALTVKEKYSKAREAPAIRIMGHVKDDQGQPLSGVVVDAMQKSGDVVFHLGGYGKTDSQGRYTLELSHKYGTKFPVPIAVWAWHKDYFDRDRGARPSLYASSIAPAPKNRWNVQPEQVVIAGEEPRIVDLTMVPGVTIHGRLLTSDGPITDGRISVAWDGMPDRWDLDTSTLVRGYAGTFRLSAPFTPLRFCYGSVESAPVVFDQPGDQNAILRLDRTADPPTLTYEPPTPKTPPPQHTASAKPAEPRKPRQDVRVRIKPVDANGNPVDGLFALTFWERREPEEVLAWERLEPERAWRDPTNGELWVVSRSGSTDHNWRSLSGPNPYRLTAVSKDPERPFDPTPFGVLDVPARGPHEEPHDVPLQLFPGVRVTFTFVDAESGLPPRPGEWDLVWTLKTSTGWRLHQGGMKCYVPPGIRRDARVDEKGRVTLQALPPGDYELTASSPVNRPGQKQYGLVDDPMRIHVTADEDQHFQIQLRGRSLTWDEFQERWPFSVYGYVMSEDGKIVAGARIVVHCPAGSLGSLGMQPIMVTQTDDDGNYWIRFGPERISRWHGSPVGRIAVTAYKEGFIERNLSKQGELYASKRAPGIANPLGIRLDKLCLPGKSVRVDFHMVPVANYVNSIRDVASSSATQGPEGLEDW